MSLGLLYIQVLKLVLIIAVGIFLEKRRILTADIQKGLSEILLNIAIPATVLMSGDIDYTDELVPNMIQIWGISMLFYMGAILIAILVSNLSGLKDERRSGFIASIVFANVAFIGYPFAEALYGKEGVLYTSVNLLVYSTFMWTYGVYIFSGVKKPDLRKFINPCTCATLIMIVMFLNRIRMPEILSGSLTLLGNMTIPLSMILIGASVSTLRIGALFQDFHSILASILRLLVLPLAVLFILILFNFSEKVIVICVILSALPAGSLNVILAQKYDCNPVFVSKVTAMSMLGFILSMPLVFQVLNLAIR